MSKCINCNLNDRVDSCFCSSCSQKITSKNVCHTCNETLNILNTITGTLSNILCFKDENTISKTMNICANCVDADKFDNSINVYCNECGSRPVAKYDLQIDFPYIGVTICYIMCSYKCNKIARRKYIKKAIPELMIHTQCNYCKISEKGCSMKQCGRCKMIRYCSVECQKSDWKQHKKTCSASTNISLH